MDIIERILSVSSSDPENIRRDVSPHGLTYLNAGKTRNCYIIECGEYEGHVLKLATTRYDKGLNKQEYQIYQSSKGTELEELLCPIEFCDNDGTRLVMKMANTDYNDNGYIRGKLEELGVYPEDVHRNNVGYHNGPVLIDYAWMPTNPL